MLSLIERADGVGARIRRAAGGAQYLGKNPPWKDVTVLVEGGRTAASSPGRPRDESLAPELH
jgi:hypothetical protein